MPKDIHFGLFGDWAKAKRLFNQLPTNLKSISAESQKLIAEKYVRAVRSHLRNQDIPGWTPLSYKYASRKLKDIGSTDMLIASWDYYNSIKAWRERNVYYTGVPISETYRNGIKIARVAAIHESWSTIPGRPHRPLWSYTFNNDMKGVRGITRLLNQIFKRKLQQKGYPVQSIGL